MMSQNWGVGGGEEELDIPKTEDSSVGEKQVEQDGCKISPSSPPLFFQGKSQQKYLSL